MPSEDLPVAEIAFPGPLRDQLVAAIVAGDKTTTSGLVADYEHEGEPLPHPGLRQMVVDTAGNRWCRSTTITVRKTKITDLDLAETRRKARGTRTFTDRRAGHARFWDAADMGAVMDDRMHQAMADAMRDGS